MYYYPNNNRKGANKKMNVFYYSPNMMKGNNYYKGGGGWNTKGTKSMMSPYKMMGYYNYNGMMTGTYAGRKNYFYAMKGKGTKNMMSPH